MKRTPIPENRLIASDVLYILNALSRHTYLTEFVDQSDMDYIRKRTHREGIQFLTTTLPKLAKAMEKGFETGRLDVPSEFKRADGTELPRLFYKTLVILYTREGELRDTPFAGSALGDTWNSVAATACRAVRQICLLVYKARQRYTPEQTTRVFEKFLETQDKVWETTKLGHSQWLASPVLYRARILVHRLVGGLNPYDIIPKHGSGACSIPDLPPWERYNPTRYIPKLDAVYPYTEFFCSWPDGLEQLIHRLRHLPTDVDPPARGAFVNKDSRGPRFISCEPPEFMYIQQGLKAKLMYDALRNRPWIQSMLDMTDQTRNQRAARLASITGRGATIDLEAASDSLSYSLVRFLFPRDWIRAFEACRSESTVIKLGDASPYSPVMEVPLWMFAPMGSACCFPVETIVFWSIVVAVCGAPSDLFDRRAKPPQTSEICIFGDDIVCPADHAKNVIEALELCGLTVNRDKSYTKGPFRESCGTDWFYGNSVRVVRLNHLPTFRKDGCYTHGFCFRLLDFLKEVQKEYHTGLDADVLEILRQRAKEPPPVYGDWLPGAYVLGSDVLVPSLKTEGVPDKPGKPFYGNQARAKVLCEKGLTRQVKTRDWSHVLRHLLSVSGDRAELVGLKDQVRYTRTWVYI